MLLQRICLHIKQANWRTLCLCIMKLWRGNSLTLVTVNVARVTEVIKGEARKSLQECGHTRWWEQTMSSDYSHIFQLQKQHTTDRSVCYTQGPVKDSPKSERTDWDLKKIESYGPINKYCSLMYVDLFISKWYLGTTLGKWHGVVDKSMQSGARQPGFEYLPLYSGLIMWLIWPSSFLTRLL